MVRGADGKVDLQRIADIILWENPVFVRDVVFGVSYPKRLSVVDVKEFGKSWQKLG
jgi:hypothetical protein